MYGGITCIDTIGDRFSIEASPAAIVPSWGLGRPSRFPVTITVLYWELSNLCFRLQ